MKFNPEQVKQIRQKITFPIVDTFDKWLQKTFNMDSYDSTFMFGKIISAINDTIEQYEFVPKDEQSVASESVVTKANRFIGE